MNQGPGAHAVTAALLGSRWVPLRKRLVPVLRRGRVVVLDRPRPCSMKEAQRALDRLVSAGIDAEIVEDEGTEINTLTNPGAGRVGPSALYVIQVPRKQAAAAKLV